MSKSDWINVMFGIIVGISIFLLIFVLFIGVQDYKEKFKKSCEKECDKFYYSFYKVEDSGFFSGYNCWCLDKNNKPINLGNINMEKKS